MTMHPPPTGQWAADAQPWATFTIGNKNGQGGKTVHAAHNEIEDVKAEMFNHHNSYVELWNTDLTLVYQAHFFLLRQWYFSKLTQVWRANLDDK